MRTGTKVRIKVHTFSIFHPGEKGKVVAKVKQAGRIEYIVQFKKGWDSFERDEMERIDK